MNKQFKHQLIDKEMAYHDKIAVITLLFCIHGTYLVACLKVQPK